jgi:hypothetical protein
MSMQLVIRPESDLLRINATGEFSLDEAKRNFEETIEAVARHKPKAVLFDGRAVTGNLQAMERFYCGEFAAQLALDYALRSASAAPRFAYVFREPVLDPKKFGETVARNRGMVVKVCDNLDEALEWLSPVLASRPHSGAK